MGPLEQAVSISSRNMARSTGRAHRSSKMFVATVAAVYIAAMFRNSIRLTMRSGSASLTFAESSSHCSISCFSFSEFKRLAEMRGKIIFLAMRKRAFRVRYE